MLMFMFKITIFIYIFFAQEKRFYLLSVSFQNHSPTSITAKHSHVTIRQLPTGAFLQEVHSALCKPEANEGIHNIGYSGSAYNSPFIF